MASKFEAKFLNFGLLVLLCQAICSDGQFQGESIKFSLAALNLPNTDVDFDGKSDPYAILFTSTKRDDEHRHWQRFGLTSTKRDTLNPDWDEVFVYQYIEGANQTWRIFVNDKDDSWFNYPFDDLLGRVDIQVEDYLREIKKFRENETTFKPIQAFLSHPVGGVLLFTPVTE